MPLQKNQVLTLTIERLSNDGSGVAHSPDGEAVFVPGTAPGDEADVRIVKDCGRYAFGILDSLRTPSPHRIPVDCAVAGPCGGCSLRHLDYAAELRSKQESVADAFRRIGGLDVPVLDALPSPEVDRYRNKVQFPVGRDKNGAPCIGFYAGRTHRIVPCPDCKLQPGVLNDIGNALCAFFAANHIQPYDEATGKGLVRHIFLRRGAHSGQIMVCIVCTRPKLPHSAELAAQLQAQFPAIATILVNVNAKNTNVILGAETHTLSGPGFIEDTLCGVPVRLGPLSFYQVNTLAAERLYGIAADYAQLQPEDLLLDLYCGMGTIGLSMADRCRELIGVEIVPQAIEDAKFNAAQNGMEKLYYEIELPLCRVLAEMEYAGVKADQMALISFGNMLQSRIEAAQQTIFDFAGREFNINSTKQLGEILFDELGLPAGKKTKSGYSTNADVLEKLKGKHPIIVEYAGDLVAAQATCLANTSFLRDAMEYHKVPTYLHSTITEIHDGGVTVKGQDGKTFEVACDNVINGIGFVPAPVGDKGRHVHRVGDCVAIGNLRTVIWRAWDVCMKI